MKYLFNYLPYIIIVGLQFVIPNYTLLMISTILVGVVASFYIKNKSIFLKSFILTFVVFAVIFFIYKSRVLYMESILNSFGLPVYSLYLIFPVFNALNVSILFLVGHKLGTIFHSITVKRTLEEVQIPYRCFFKSIMMPQDYLKRVIPFTKLILYISYII